MLIHHQCQAAETTRLEQQFILVVVDGDSIPFKDQFYCRGRDGGAALGSQLKNAIHQHLKNEENYRYRMPIIIKVYGYTSGIAKTLQRGKIVQQASDFDHFTEGLASTPLTEFVNVGEGKERADKKVSGTLIVSLSSNDSQTNSPYRVDAFVC